MENSTAYPAKAAPAQTPTAMPTPGQVLGALKPVGVLLGWRTPRQTEPEEHHGAGRHVRKIMDRITQEPDRTRQHRQQQLDQAGDCQTDRADGNSAVSLPSLVLIISRADERERQRRISLSMGLVHPARIISVGPGPSPPTPSVSAAVVGRTAQPCSETSPFPSCHIS
jgi:hypothetical protein